MPITYKGELSRAACRRTTRSKVSLLTGSISRRGRAAAQGNAEMVDDRFQPASASGRSAGHRMIEPLREYASPATGCSAANRRTATRQLDGVTVGRQVEEPPLIAAVHPPGLPSAIGDLPAAARHRAVMTMRSGPISTSSINKPAGDND